MPKIEREITVNAPVEKVFGYLADFARHPEWAAHPLTVTPASPGAAATGAKFESVGHMMGKDFHDHGTVTEVLPNERITFEVDSNGSYLRHGFGLRSQGNQTVVSKSMEPLKAAFPFSVLGPVLAITGVLAKGLDGDLARIKAKVEG